MGGIGRTSSEGFDPYHKWLGIRPEEHPINHYRLLGLALFENDPDVIANAADQRMGIVRSFQTGKHAELSQRLLNEIAAARVCLLNPEKKAAYDKLLQYELATGSLPARKPPSAVSGAEASGAVGGRASAAAEAKSPGLQASVQRRPRLHFLVAGGAVICVLTVTMVWVVISRGWRAPAQADFPRESGQKSEVEKTAQPGKPESAPRARDASPASPVQRPAKAKSHEAVRSSNAAGKGELSGFVGANTPSPAKQGRAAEGPPVVGAKDPVSSARLDDQPPADQASASKAAPPVQEAEPAGGPPEATASENSAERLQQSLRKAQSPADFRLLAESGLASAEQAVAAGKRDLAMRLATLALAAARKSDDPKLAARVTLRLIELREQPPK